MLVKGGPGCKAFHALSLYHIGSKAMGLASDGGETSNQVYSVFLIYLTKPHYDFFLHV